MKRIIVALLCVCLLLSACSSGETETTETTAQTTTAAPTEETTVPPTTQEETVPPTTEEETVPPTTEEVILYRHPLTGELLEEPFTVRPVAVSTNNYSPAQPILGVGHADIIFEHITEVLGSETRMLAIYTDLAFDGQVGSIRSGRTYSVNIAKSFNAPIVHCGESYLATDLLKSYKYPSFDEFDYGKHFYRDQGRRSAGYSNEHTLVTEGNKLLNGLITEGFDLTAPEDAYYGFDFTEDPQLNGGTANTVTIQFYNNEGKRTIMTYNESDGMYHGVQKWYRKQNALADGNTGDDVPFRNVLVMYVKVTGVSGKANVLQEVIGEGKGWFACDGEYVAIRWSRATADDHYTFTLEDGTPLTMGVGKTYVAMLPTKSPDVIFE